MRGLAAAAAEVFVPLGHPAGPCPGRLRRGDRHHRRGGAQDPLLRVRPAALRRLLCGGLSGGDDGSVLRRPRAGLQRSSAACRSRSSTTTPRSRWRASWATASGSARGCSASCNRITCSRIGSADRARATTRARSKGWSAIARRNFLVPIPVFDSFEALNAHLLDVLPQAA